MIDPTREVLKIKDAYAKARGFDLSTGRFMARNKAVPRTTWGDVFLAGAHINKYLNPNQEQCIEIVRAAKGMSHEEADYYCRYKNAAPNRFSRTPSFNRALNEFKSSAPLVAYGPSSLLKIASSEIYPKNEEFWGAAQRFAIARAGAGAVPHWSTLATEALDERLKEIAEGDYVGEEWRGVGRAVAKAVRDNMPDVPDVGPYVKLIKWGSIGGGLFLLYWYVLKPKR